MARIDLGIDLGTTNSVASVWRSGQPVALPIQRRLPRELFRSVALFAPDRVYTGEEALSRERAMPARAVRSIKTDMGTAKTRAFDGKDYRPEEISALILGEIVARARDAYARLAGETEVEIDAITVTVPARFNLNAIKATQTAAELAGFAGERVRILRESDAAALAYIRGDPKPQTVLVYDLGGGTFDLSVLRFTGKAPTFFEHIGPPGGDPRLGGDVFDDRLRDRLAAFAHAQGLPHDLSREAPGEGVAPDAWIGARLILLDQARLAKETVCDPSLSDDYPHEVYLPELLGHAVSAPFVLTRADFHALIQDRLDAAMTELRRLLKELKLDPGDIDRVVLAGGSTRIPAVKRQLRDFFGIQPNDSLESDKAISYGACVYNQLYGAGSKLDREAIIPPAYLTVPVGLRITKPLSESLGGASRDEFEPILERGLRCPDQRARTFTTIRHRQERLRFEVYVQEGGHCRPENFVAFYELHLPEAARGPRGGPKIDVTFAVNATGSGLTVSAVERTTGVEIREITQLDHREQIRPEPREDAEITLDEFGNPQGLQWDLGGDLNEICAGKRILLYAAFDDRIEPHNWDDAVGAVKERGLLMDVRRRAAQGPIDDVDLEQYDQLWFVSERTPTLSPQATAAIERFVRAGKGLLIWTDNAPYFADGNTLAERLAQSSFSGYWHGDKVLQPGEVVAAGAFIEHPLTSGINNLYEGITISQIHPGPKVTVLAQGTDGYPCMAAYDDGVSRIVLDTGFTKLSGDRFHRTAGTARYFRNIAFWLLKEARPYTA